jgi:hypothetical protein
MISIYVNGANLQLNEVAMITFNENSQTGMNGVVKIAMTYEVFKLIYENWGQAIQQHDMKLHELQRTKENMN